MVKYFCECCGKEMDNSISHQLLFKHKSKGDSSEEYSVCDEEVKMCDDCFITMLGIMDNWNEVIKHPDSITIATAPAEHVEEHHQKTEDKLLHEHPINNPACISEWLGWAIAKLIIGICNLFIIIWCDVILGAYDFIHYQINKHRVIRQQKKLERTLDILSIDIPAEPQTEEGESFNDV